MTNTDGSLRPGRILALVAAMWLGIWLLWFVIDWVGSRATPQAGQIGVVRSGSDGVWLGSWFNGHGIHSVVPPGSGSTYIGLGSTVHWYPADTQQRFYTITSDPSRGDRPGVDVVEVPTSDGVRVGLEGTFFFTTAFNSSPSGETVLKSFDNQFGTRTFPVVGQQGTELSPWDGTIGWASFLDTVIRPVIENDLRRSIASVSCAQLVSSCALVHQATAIHAGGSQNSAEIQSIQDTINASLKADITSTIGQDYFSNVRFLLSKVTLPVAIQDQIDQAQAQYAAVATSAARVQQAEQDAKANAIREQGYKNCPACSAIDELKAIPPNVTTFAPGAGFAITK